nr:hypothetical protein [Tanacetum cinerariifolium]
MVKTNWCIDNVDINVLRFFETKFPAIAYNDNLELKHISLSSGDIKRVNFENITPLPKSDYGFKKERIALKNRFSKKEKFNILNIAEDLFSYEVLSSFDFQLNKGIDDAKERSNNENPIKSNQGCIGEYGLMINDDDVDWMFDHFLCEVEPLTMNNIMDERIEEKRLKLIGTPQEQVASIEREFDVWARANGYINENGG